MEVRVDLPAKANVLFEPHRFKVLYGGRASGKSWSIARALLVSGVCKPERILCALQTQVSIKETVIQLLLDQIEDLGLSSFYKPTNNTIRGHNGTQFFFAGLRNNIPQIKAMENVTKCWLENAQTASEPSLDLLAKVVQGELWYSFNPDLETDPVYKRFIVDHREDAAVVKMNWSDNPWFSETLRAEKDWMKAHDPERYRVVWEGFCRA